MIAAPSPSLIGPTPELARIRLLCCDVDGVMTDGGLYYDADGEAQKRFHVLDGQGLKMLMREGVAVCVVTQGRAGSIAARAQALGIEHVFTGVEDKTVPVRILMQRLGLASEQVAHIADDVNDLSLLAFVGLPITVPNGVSEVSRICRFITHTPGGTGAVREVCDAILAARAQWPDRP